MRGPREGAVDVAVRTRPAHERVVGGPRVDDRVQGLVVDLDQLGPVLGQRARLGHDRGHRLADVAHLLLGQHRVLLVGHLHAVERHPGIAPHAAGQVGGGDHGEHARGPIDHGDRADARVGVRAAHEGHMRHPLELDVVDVARATP